MALKFCVKRSELENKTSNPGCFSLRHYNYCTTWKKQTKNTEMQTKYTGLQITVVSFTIITIFAM